MFCWTNLLQWCESEIASFCYTDGRPNSLLSLLLGRQNFLHPSLMTLQNILLNIFSPYVGEIISLFILGETSFSQLQIGSRSVHYSIVTLGHWLV